MRARRGKNLNAAVERKDGVRRFGVHVFWNWRDAGNIPGKKSFCVRWSGRCNEYYKYMKRKLLENGVVFGGMAKL